MGRASATHSAGRKESLDDPLALLMARVAAGQERALADLYDATSHRVYGLVLHILREREAAEEATLDVYTQIWRRGAQYDPSRGSVMGFVLTLARTRGVDLLRARVRRSGFENPLQDALDLADPGPSPEMVSRDSLAARRLHVALEALPRDQRQAIEAAYFGGLSHKEVAKSLGQPLGTVKTRIRDGLMALRRVMAIREEGLA